MSELDEIKNEVLVENNAQFIFQHIKDLENDIIKHGKRWFWELLQNAKDAKKDNESVKIETFYDGGKVIFRHSGTEFKRKEIAHLIFHGSTKKNDISKTGKFGTGFMTTHLLSKEVIIEGKLFDGGNCFRFVLDRNGNNDAELQKTLEESWKRFENSKIECDEKSIFNTQFTYNINPSRREIVESALKNLKQTIPFVLSSNSEIQEVIISNSENSFSIKKEEANIVNDSFQEFQINIDTSKIQIIKIEKEVNIEFGYKKEDIAVTTSEIINISVSLELDNNSLKKIDKTIPRLFYDFPLFTTERLGIPVIINSLSFEPKPERDGIYLGPTETYDVQKNKAILSKAFKIFLNLADELIDRNTKDIYLIAKIKKINFADVDNEWFNQELSHIISELTDKKIIRSDGGKLINLSEAIIPLMTTTPCEYDIDFWLLVKKIFPDKIVLKEHHGKWIDIITDWKEFKGESFVFEKNIQDISKIIEQEKNIKQFSIQYFGNEIEDAYRWLNHFYALINNNHKNHILESTAIIPNQDGEFVKKTSEIKLDKEIDEELKHILNLLGENIREVLISNEITYFNDKSIFSFKTQQEVYEHTISSIKNIEKSFEKTEFEASLEMMRWLLANEKYEPLEGFPISIKLEEEKRNVYKLSTKQKLLVPVSLWNPESFRKYSDIFSDELILNEEYGNILAYYVSTLEDKGFIYSNPLYNEMRRFTREDLQKVIPEKIEDNFWGDAEDDVEQIEIPEILVSHIAYFNNPSEKSVLRNSRKSRKQTQKLLEFIFNCVLTTDNLIFEEKEIFIKGKSLKVYPSHWLAKLKSNQWVNIGKDKDESPTSSNLSFFFEKSDELKEKLKNEKVAKLLNIIGVSVGDLTKNIYAKTDKEKLEWDKAYTSILSAGHENSITAEEIQNIFNDEFLIQEIKTKYKEKQVVKNNRNIGLTVEDIFQEILTNELNTLNLKIKKVIVGRDFDVEFDFIDEENEKLFSIERKDLKYPIELKSTRTDYIRMTRAQGRRATDNPDNFSLCVFQHSYDLDDFKDETGRIKVDIREKIKSEIRFVTNIGNSLIKEVKKVQELDEKIKVTKLSSSEIEVDIEEGEVKYKIHEKVWESSMKLEAFITYIKSKFG